MRLQIKPNAKNAIKLPAMKPAPSFLASSDISDPHRFPENEEEVPGVPRERPEAILQGSLERLRPRAYRPGLGANLSGRS